MPTKVVNQSGRTSLHCCHQPRCDKPWPCGPARAGRKAEHGHVQVAIYMWQRLEEAVHDPPPAPAAEIFERFIKWTG
jgi:hypothetical protein